MGKCYLSLCHRWRKCDTERTSKLPNAQRLQRIGNLKEIIDFSVDGIKNFYAPFFFVLVIVLAIFVGYLLKSEK